MEIRQALGTDAPAACEVLRRSIAELCVADHQNDPEILRRWLANKTPDHVRSWIIDPDNTLLVAVEHDAILGVGAVTRAGEITLNYVSPDARFCGISRAMIGALEYRASQQGNTKCHLTSTETARRLYIGLGYIWDGAQSGEFGTSGSYKMSKMITRAQSNT